MTSTDTYQLKWHSHSSHMNGSVAALLRSERFTDVVLCTIDGSQIPAHKFILSSCSVYLSSLFEGQRSVMRMGGMLYVVLPPEISTKALKTLVEYMYKGETTVSNEVLDTVLKAGEVLKIRGLWRQADESGTPADTADKTILNQAAPTAGTNKQNSKKPEDGQAKIAVKKDDKLLKAFTPVQGGAQGMTRPMFIGPPKLVFIKTSEGGTQAALRPCGPKGQTILVAPAPTSTSEVSTVSIAPTTSTASPMVEISEDTPPPRILRRSVPEKKYGKRQKTESNVEEEAKDSDGNNDNSSESSKKSNQSAPETNTEIQIKDEPEWDASSIEEEERSIAEMFQAEMSVKSEPTDEVEIEEESLVYSPLACELCAEVFTVPAAWVRHVQGHAHDAPSVANRTGEDGEETMALLRCDLCQKHFPNPAQWVRHIQSTHTETEGAQNKTCSHCKKTFPSHASMLIHMRTHTGMAKARASTEQIEEVIHIVEDEETIEIAGEIVLGYTEGNNEPNIQQPQAPVNNEPDTQQPQAPVNNEVQYPALLEYFNGQAILHTDPINVQYHPVILQVGGENSPPTYLLANALTTDQTIILENNANVNLQAQSAKQITETPHVQVSDQNNIQPRIHDSTPKRRQSIILSTQQVQATGSNVQGHSCKKGIVSDRCVSQNNNQTASQGPVVPRSTNKVDAQVQSVSQPQTSLPGPNVSQSINQSNAQVRSVSQNQTASPDRMTSQDINQENTQVQSISQNQSTSTSRIISQAFNQAIASEQTESQSVIQDTERAQSVTQIVNKMTTPERPILPQAVNQCPMSVQPVTRTIGRGAISIRAIPKGENQDTISVIPISPNPNKSAISIHRISTCDKKGAAPGQSLTQNVSLGATPGRPIPQSVNQGAMSVRPIAQNPNQSSVSVRPIDQSMNQRSTYVRPISQCIYQSSASGQPIAQNVNQSSTLGRPMAQSVHQNSKSGQPIAQSMNQTSVSGQPIVQNIIQSSTSVRPIAQSVNQSFTSVRPMAQSINLNSASGKPIAQSINQSSTSVRPTAQNTNQNSASVQPTAQSVNQTSALGQPIAQSVNQSTTPGQPIARSVNQNSSSVRPIAPNPNQGTISVRPMSQIMAPAPAPRPTVTLSVSQATTLNRYIPLVTRIREDPQVTAARCRAFRKRQRQSSATMPTNE